jgi:pectinesterase
MMLLNSPKGKALLFFLMHILLISVSAGYAQYDIVVAKDGSGNYTTVQAAVNAAPSNSSTRTTIYIKNGSYYEVITVPTNKTNLTFIGQSNTGTILTYDNYASKINPATGAAYGTSGSASTFINGAGFYALNIAFANSAGPVGQAVAVRSTADKAIFKNCRFLGYQDTYYAHSGRSYHEACYFEGSTDFIFGGAISFFENCDIYSKGGTSLTAANTAQHIAYGYVFNNCRITGAGSNITDLGRPWGPYASVTFRNTSMTNTIKAAGWNDWGNAANQATARFNEFANSGAGYVPASRPSWVHILTSAQAASYTMLNVLKANSANPQVTDNWNPQTTINATPGGGTAVNAFSTIQAESYTAMSGVQNETCSEGGQDVGFIHNNDWIKFSVNFGSGVTGFSARVASNTTGGTIKLRLGSAGGTQIGTCNVVNTGGWQSWTTVTGTASGTSGVQDLYLVFAGTTTDYLFNINNFVFTGSGSRLETIAEPTSTTENLVRLYPSPAGQQMTIDLSGLLHKNARYLIYDDLGRQVLASTIKGNKTSIGVGSLTPGVYTVRLFNGKETVIKKFLKK